MWPQGRRDNHRSIQTVRVVVDGEQVVASVEDYVEGVWPDAVAAAESG